MIEKPGRREIAPIHSVVTTQGTFGFLASISEFKIICLALATHARSLSEAKWRSEETDVLGGTASLWTSHCEGVGKRIYHYRTRTNRSLLSLALFFSVMPTLSILIQQWSGFAAKSSIFSACGFALVLGLPVLLGIWRYSTAKIETDSEGITQWALGGARHLAWDEVEDYYQSGNRIQIDISIWLEDGLLLREKDFRSKLKTHTWEIYKDSFVAVNCATDAILPAWATILVTVFASKYAKKVVAGNLLDLEISLYQDILSTIDFSIFENKPLILKGCSKKPVPEEAYTLAVQKLLPYAKSIMYGEACSAVPLYKM